MKIGAAAMLSAAVAWVVKPASSSPPAMVVAQADAAPDFSPAFPHEALTPVAAFHESRSVRNPFAYVEPPPAPVVVAATEEPPQPPPVIVVAQPESPRPNPLPAFPYRFIGRFGPDDDPLAAFTRDGEVITVRRGATIDGQFLVRTIGIESVEIGYVQRDGTIRLSLDGNV
jgi:hypothetical protein